MYFIPLCKKYQFGQSIREDGPQSHAKKSGTPTMGGITFIFAMICTLPFFVHFTFDIWFVLLLTIGYGFIGFLDDGIKVFNKRNLGFTAKQKMLAQVVLATIAFLALYVNGFDTTVSIPGTAISLDFGFFYLPFLLFLMVGTTNAVNLTDGLDGLVGGISTIVFATMGVIAWSIGNQELLLLCIAIIGALCGFLLFNINPAKVFMGDTGSLALGGAIVGIAILTKTEALLAIIGGIFVIETLSVIIQVISFKTTGKRVFKMSPLHHHFELSGWSEVRVVQTFWVSQLVLSLCALLLFL